MSVRQLWEQAEREMERKKAFSCGETQSLCFPVRTRELNSLISFQEPVPSFQRDKASSFLFFFWSLSDTLNSKEVSDPFFFSSCWSNQKESSPGCAHLVCISVCWMHEKIWGNGYVVVEQRDGKRGILKGVSLKMSLDIDPTHQIARCCSHGWVSPPAGIKSYDNGSTLNFNVKLVPVWPGTFLSQPPNCGGEENAEISPSPGCQFNEELTKSFFLLYMRALSILPNSSNDLRLLFSISLMDRTSLVGRDLWRLAQRAHVKPVPFLITFSPSMPMGKAPRRILSIHPSSSWCWHPSLAALPSSLALQMLLSELLLSKLMLGNLLITLASSWLGRSQAFIAFANKAFTIA